MIRVVVHEQGPRATVSSKTTQGDSKCNLKQLWDSLTTCVDPHRCFADDSNALFWSMCRAVWNVCQQKIVSVKECDSDEEKNADPAEEASLAADKVSLLRLFALFASMKVHTEPALSMLQALTMTKSEKADQPPTNLQLLDKGGLIFPKKELLGFFNGIGACIDLQTQH